MTTTWRRSVVPPIAFALRAWASVTLALYLAFQLQLDNPYWAGVTAVIVSQSSLEGALLKGASRFLGTIVGAAVAVALAACFLQNGAGFLASLSIWCGLCAFATTLLRGQSAYAAALAGYTSVIVVSGVIGPAGRVAGDIFMIGLTRASEISVGIAATFVVFIGTTRPQPRPDGVVAAAHLGDDIADALRLMLLAFNSDPAFEPKQRDLLARAIDLLGQIDSGAKESEGDRRKTARARACISHIIVALVGAHRLETLQAALLTDERHKFGQRLKCVLCDTLDRSPPFEAPICNPAGAWFQKAMRVSARRCIQLGDGDATFRIIADTAAEALFALARASQALAAAPTDATRSLPLNCLPNSGRLLDASIGAARAVIVVGAVEWLWIATAWPDGPIAVAYAAVSVVLFSPKGELGYASTMSFVSGCALGIGLASVVKFAVLPMCSDFWELSAAIGFVLVPLCALSVHGPLASAFLFAAVNFGVGLNVGNVMSYDTVGYYNQLLAICVGTLAACLSMAFIPPLSVDAQIRLALAGMLRDAGCLSSARRTLGRWDWGKATYSRLTSVPRPFDPARLAELLEAYTLGDEILRLRRAKRQASGSSPCLEIEPANARLWRRRAEMRVQGHNDAIIRIVARIAPHYTRVTPA